jgi:hypothetical protein
LDGFGGVLYIARGVWALTLGTDWKHHSRRYGGNNSSSTSRRIHSLKPGV